MSTGPDAYSPAGPANAIRGPRSFGKRREPATITIARNGSSRQLRINPFLLSILFSLTLMFGVGYMAAAAYLIFRDDLIGAAHVRDARLRREYEDRITSLRANLDIIISRQLIDQQAIEAKIADLLARQNQLDGSGGQTGALVEEARKRGIGAPETKNDAQTVDRDLKTGSAEPGKKLLRSSAVQFEMRGSAGLLPGAPNEAALPRFAAEPRAPDFSQISASIGAIEAGQKTVVEKLQGAAALRVAKMVAIIGELDLADAAPGEIGGPFLAVDPVASFDNQTAALKTSLAAFDELSARLASLPLASPAPGEEITSAFGNRIDPFLGSMAMHSGIDFRAAYDTPVSVTAPGIVTEAGYSAGYGNMVEVRHGANLSTRYAHLSRIDVSVGDKLAPRANIGLAGSSGRSTGPHVHYEVRKDGEPVDPARFLKAGRALAKAG